MYCNNLTPLLGSLLYNAQVWSPKLAINLTSLGYNRSMELASIYGRRFILATALLSATDILLWLLRVILTGSNRYSFIIWNLILAWISFEMAYLLVRNLKKVRWANWENAVLSFLWLAFLPNSWYVLTDFIHIIPTGEISQLYDIVLISLLVINGFALGFTGLFLVHRELLKRFGIFKSYLTVEGIILLSSFAIFLGRDLRWNSWDVITNPQGIIINVSDQIIDPFGNPRAFNVTILFFILISVIYAAFTILTYPSRRR